MASPAEELEKLNWHWRNSMRPIRFFHFDYRLSFFAFFSIMYIRLVTIALMLTLMMIFWTLERRGLTFPAAVRNLRSWVVGPNRPGWLSLRHRRFRDYG